MSDTIKIYINQTQPVKAITVAPTGATGPGVPTGGATNDILKKTSSTNYDTAWETPTSTATASTIVRRDASGGAAFDDLTSTGLVVLGNVGIGSIDTLLTSRQLLMYGEGSVIANPYQNSQIYNGSNDSPIYTAGANSPIHTINSTSDIYTQHATSSVKSYNFAAYDATVGAALRDSAGTAYLTWGATAGNISITVDTNSTGHFLSNPGTATAGHFITKNGTAPTIIAGRSAWFSNGSGDPQFRNGTSAAVTIATLAGSETLTNKTLTSPIITGNLTVDTDTFFVDGTNNRVGIGTVSPDFILTIGDGTLGTLKYNHNLGAGGSAGSSSLTMSTGSSSAASAGAYVIMSGKLESFVTIGATGATSGNRQIRFGNTRNGVVDTSAGAFVIQRLNDALSSITATPFQITNSAPSNCIMVNASGGVTIGATTDAGATNLLVAGTAKSNGGFVYGTFTVATFPTTTYLEAVVTDALAPIQGATVAAGGSAKCKVMYNGSAKIVTAVL